jgi:5-methylcytosine-specific restriction protein A
MAPLSAKFQEVLEVVPQPRTGPHIDKTDRLWSLVTDELQNQIAAFVDDDVSFKTQGSAGQGNWCQTPWVSVFDRLITESATRGFYLVYLIRSDGERVYLSLNQGTTAVFRTTGAGEYERVLEACASAYVGYLEHQDLSGLSIGRIDLGGGRPPLTPGYEAGNIVALSYQRDAIPTDAQLELDLQRLLGLYRQLVRARDEVEADEDPELPPNLKTHTERRHWRWHRRAEGRNRRAVRDAKRFHGYECRVCGVDYQALYGKAGERCVDAHHVTPFSKLEEGPTPLNPKTDFVIVDASCHRLIHSRAEPLTIQEARAMRKRVGLPISRRPV